MQIVIDIPEEEYRCVQITGCIGNKTCISNAIYNGTPLPKTGHCKDCKWWKDSDGTYCRGVHAESKCPINRKEVYEGNGYCYMFEPQERSSKE